MFTQHLAGLARQTWSGLPQADTDAAVDAGMLASVSEPGPQDRDQTMSGERTAFEVGQASAVVQRQGLPTSMATAADWRGHGAVIPVLSGSPGAGASVVAAVLADAIQHAGWRVLLADTADPARSGLAMAASSEGPAIAGPDERVRIRCSQRDKALLARVETALPVLAPGMVPPPRFWYPPQGAPQITVVDIGHDPWRVAAHPLAGAGAWLRAGQPMPRPVLVCRATRPSLAAVEQILERLGRWVDAGVAAPVAQLVVTGAKKWPNGVSGVAGRRTASLLGQAVFVPHDRNLEISGITDTVMPLRLRQAVAGLLRRWNVLGTSTSTSTKRKT